MSPLMQRSRVTAVTLLIVSLLTGGLAGWLVHERFDDRGARRGRRGPDRLVERLTQELDLSSVQQDSVRAILERGRTRTDVLWEEMHPRFTEVRNRTRREIEAQLEPEQVVRYREREAEADARRARMDSLRSSRRERR